MRARVCKIVSNIIFNKIESRVVQVLYILYIKFFRYKI